MDAERKPYHFHLVRDDALPDVANSIKNVFKTKLKLDSPLSESDRRGSQLQFCWMRILQFSLPGGRQRTHPKANSATDSILADSARIGFRLNLTLGGQACSL